MTNSYHSTPKRGSSIGSIALAIAVVIAGAFFWYWGRFFWSSDPGPEIESTTTQRLKAIEELIREGEAAVPALIEILSADSPEARIDAATVLGRIGPEAREAVPALLASIDKPSWTEREAAITALGRIGADVSSAIERIALRLADESKEVREVAARLLIANGEVSIPAVRAALAHANPEVRNLAARTLQDLSADDPETLDQVRAALITGDPTCEYLEVALPLLLQSGRSTREDFQAALQSGSSNLILAGITALMAQGTPDAELAPDLGALLAGDYFRRSQPPCDPPIDRVRTEAIQLRALECLSWMGPAAALAEPDLRHLMEDDLVSSKTKLAAIRALWSLGADRRLYMPHLVRLVAYERHFERYYEPGTEKRMAGAVQEIAPGEIPTVIRELRHRLRTEDRSNLYYIISLIGQFGPEAGPALPDLLPLIDAWESPFFYPALFSIGKLGPAAAPALPTLERLLDPRLAPKISDQGRVDSLYYPQAIPDALAAIGPTAAPLRPTLLALYESPPKIKRIPGDERDPAGAFRLSALKALDAIRGAEEVVYQGMRDFASHPDLWLSLAAIEFLLTNDRDPEFAIASLAEQITRVTGSQQSAQLQQSLRFLNSRLPELGARSAPCLFPLALLAENGSPYERAEVLRTLAAAISYQPSWSPEDPIVQKILPRMIEHVSSSDEPICFYAAQIIGAFGPAAARAIPTLEAALARGNDSYRARSEAFRGVPRRRWETAIRNLSSTETDSSRPTSYISALQQSLARVRPAAAASN